MRRSTLTPSSSYAAEEQGGSGQSAQQIGEGNAIEVHNLSKRFSARQTEVVAVDDVAFAVEAGQFVCLLGPSGCGKSTTLRCIAGLERPDTGTVIIGGRTVFDSSSGAYVATEARGLGMVFQSYAIWPHMTVFENVAFPLRRGLHKGRYSRSEVKVRVQQILEIVDCGGFAERHPSELSGGQQQRIALARALVYEPKVLLFDEPLSNLDAKLRERMRAELRQIQERAGFAAVYVTHDQEEALGLSDRVAVMANGRIRQFGTPEAVYNYPIDGFVGDFIGAANVIPVVSYSLGANAAGTALGSIRFGRRSEAIGDGADDTLQIVIRPEHVEFVVEGEPTGDDVFEGRVVSSGYRGDCYMYTLAASDVMLRALDRSSGRRAVGEAVRFRLSPANCHLLPSGGVAGSQQGKSAP